MVQKTRGELLFFIPPFLWKLKAIFSKSQLTFKQHIVKDEEDRSRAAYFLYINRDVAFHFDWDELYVFCSLLEYALPKIAGFDVPRRQAESSNVEEQQTQSIDTSKEESMQPEADIELEKASLDDDFSSDFEI